MPETFFVVDIEQHNSIVESAYLKRGFNADESAAAAKFSAHASWHGIRTHNAIKALHLDDHFGSKHEHQGCVPNAQIEKRETKFAASEIWNANRKLGQATAYEAMETAIAMADKYGIGQVSVDNAFHYLWGGGYVMDAAKRGYIAYTNCTAALAEVVPFMGKYPTLGTNPHSWGFPTTDAIGYPVVIDWATSVVAMGRVQQFKREGKSIPEGAGVDADGNMTTDPNKVTALTTFGRHKGYGLSLINEIVAAMIGGSLPTVRCRWDRAENEKYTPAFYFQVMHPDAISSGSFSQGRTQAENLKSVLHDIIGHGNDACLLPGQLEANSASESEKHGGLLFSSAEVDEFNAIATECGLPTWNKDDLKTTA